MDGMSKEQMKSALRYVLYLARKKSKSQHLEVYVPDGDGSRKINDEQLLEGGVEDAWMSEDGKIRKEEVGEADAGGKEGGALQDG